MKTVKGLVIQTDGTCEVREIEPTLENLQSIVDGDIESLSFTSVAHMYLNEDGKQLGLPANMVATNLVESFRQGFKNRDVIVGTVIVLSMTPDGEEADVPIGIVARCLDSYPR